MKEAAITNAIPGRSYLRSSLAKMADEIKESLSVGVIDTML